MVTIRPPPIIGSVCCEEDGVVAEVSAPVPLVVAALLPSVRVCVEYDPSVLAGVGDESVVTEVISRALGLAEAGDVRSCTSPVLPRDEVLSEVFGRVLS